MPIEVLMPALSPTMEKGKLAKWVKNEGDKVKSGDIIAEIETDKATMEVEAVDEGTLGKILVPEGTDDVAVNTPIAVILARARTRRAIEVAARRRSSPRAAESRRRSADAELPAKPEAARRRRPRRAKRRRAAPRRGRLARAGRAGRHRDGHHDGARSAARRHGRGDAARRRRVRDGRGGRRVSGRLQGHPGPAAGVRRASA